uniref:Uncharacterized protein n=1 Tax=Hyaloperonospora arabidopsidis (strain Emoy2) TaxID=559515 RepID=M4B3Y7_HYAAE
MCHTFFNDLRLVKRWIEPVIIGLERRCLPKVPGGNPHQWIIPPLSMSIGHGAFFCKICNGVTQTVLIPRYAGVIYTERDQFH